MRMHKLTRLIIGILFCAQSATLLAQDLTPQDFLQADVEARRLTLDGMSQQIALINAGASAEEINQAVADNQTNVEAIFSSFGTNGAAHSAYGTQSRAEIDAWMTENPEWQETYDSLNTEFDTLSQQLSTLREGQ